MSIETLLEAARFLELQAQQQQKTREENEVKEHLEREAEKRRAEAAALDHHTAWVEDLFIERRLAPAPPQPPPPTVPITVIPIPVVPSNHSSLPAAAAITPPAPLRLGSPPKEVHSPSDQPAKPQHLLISPQPPEAEPASLSHPASIKHQHLHLVQPYSGTIVTTSQHPLQPQPTPPPIQPSPFPRGSSPDDGRHGDGKKRPGGAGTREVHNKLEKNRRAHLKECFETLKKNIPSVDEKKTSNLSVLRSALRYIQTLKRKEKEFEHEMERLAREKIATQQRLAELKNELGQWMDVMEVDRVLRQTVQPEDDQASTSTASEGEDVIDEDVEDENLTLVPGHVPKVPPAPQPDVKMSVPNPAHLNQHKPTHPLVSAPVLASISPSPAATQPPMVQAHLAQPVVAPQTLLPAPTRMVAAPSIQPTVIAHAAPATHASVIQAVNHVIQPGAKHHIAHIAPSTTSPVQLAPSAVAAPQTISHITVHPVAHLGQHLPALYPQPMAVAQPTVVSHIAHTLSHAQVNGTSPGPQAAATATVVAKQAAMGAQVVAHHPQLVSQTVLNPVTMVTMPSFPVSTLKLA
uniref:Max-binding protein MNT n=1 Tax=Denticeps clupeoides TaxID=299321 RepID=A0AAY4C8H9_9TELE